MQTEAFRQGRAARTALELAGAQLAQQGAEGSAAGFVWPLDAITLEASFPQGLQLREAAHFKALGVVCHAECAARSRLQAMAVGAASQIQARGSSLTADQHVPAAHACLRPHDHVICLLRHCCVSVPIRDPAHGQEVREAHERRSGHHQRALLGSTLVWTEGPAGGR